MSNDSNKKTIQNIAVDEEGYYVGWKSGDKQYNFAVHMLLEPRLNSPSRCYFYDTMNEAYEAKDYLESKTSLVFPNIYVSEHPMCPKTTQTYVYVSKDLCLFVQRPMFKIYVYVSKDQRSRRSKASNVFIYRMCSLTIECVLLL